MDRRRFEEKIRRDQQRFLLVMARHDLGNAIAPGDRRRVRAPEDCGARTGERR
jgi:hypothetical protein